MRQRPRELFQNRSELKTQAEQDEIETDTYFDRCYTGASGFGYVAIMSAVERACDDLDAPRKFMLVTERRFVIRVPR